MMAAITIAVSRGIVFLHGLLGKCSAKMPLAALIPIKWRIAVDGARLHRRSGPVRNRHDADISAALGFDACASKAHA
jgi:hypothetical protein